MGGCGTKELRWAPAVDDGNVKWMIDYEAMIADMVKRDVSPEQWELDLGKKVFLCNPPWEKKGDLEHGPHIHARQEIWSTFKKDVHKIEDDCEQLLKHGEDPIETIKHFAALHLSTSPYMQMRAQQWMTHLKEQREKIDPVLEAKIQDA